MRNLPRSKESFTDRNCDVFGKFCILISPSNLFIFCIWSQITFLRQGNSSISWCMIHWFVLRFWFGRWRCRVGVIVVDCFSSFIDIFVLVFGWDVVVVEILLCWLLWLLVCSDGHDCGNDGFLSLSAFIDVLCYFLLFPLLNLQLYKYH